MSPRLMSRVSRLWPISKTEASGRIALPEKIERVSVAHFVEAPVGPVYAVGRPAATGDFDAVVVDSTGRLLVVLRGYSTAEVPDSIDKNLLRDTLAHFDVAVAG